MLYCLLVYELIRSERAIYEKKIIIPTGTLSTSRILSILRININDKVEIHKWAFYILKRIGLDTDTYLGLTGLALEIAQEFSFWANTVYHDISGEG